LKNAFNVRGGSNSRGRRDFNKNKTSRYYDHCQRSRHTTNQCFKIIGYHDLYQGPRDNSRPKKDIRAATHLVSSDSSHDTPLDYSLGSQETNTTITPSSGKVDSNLVQALAQEMMRLVKGQTGMDMHSSNHNAFAHFAGMTFTGSRSPTSCVVLNTILGSWIIDTGASDHMNYDLNLFSRTTSLPTPIKVTLPDGTLKPVTLVGDVQISPTLTLHNALFMPDNLLSVAKFLNDSTCCTIFYPNHCIFQDLSTRLLVAVDRKAGGLYTLENTHSRGRVSSSPASSATKNQDFSTCNKSACKSDDLDVLHARLGHTSFSKIQHIADWQPFLSNDYFCETCVLAKFHRLPFNKSTIATTAPFQLIHMDLWGPYRVTSVTGAKYFLTIVDDFSRSTWTHMLQTKTQVFSSIKQFYDMIATQFKVNILMIRSDNGSEFIHSACLDFFASKGILH